MRIWMPIHVCKIVKKGELNKFISHIYKLIKYFKVLTDKLQHLGATL